MQVFLLLRRLGCAHFEHFVAGLILARFRSQQIIPPHLLRLSLLTVKLHDVDGSYYQVGKWIYSVTATMVTTKMIPFCDNVVITAKAAAEMKAAGAWEMFCALSLCVGVG